jgi:hypothetical protein
MSGAERMARVEREERALDAIIVSCLRCPDDDGDLDTDRLPELTDEDRAAMDALGPDFIDRLLAGERPLGDPGTRANPS